jgi:hypothetical protein
VCNLVNKELERTWNRAVVYSSVHSTGILPAGKEAQPQTLNIDGVRVGTLLAGAHSEIFSLPPMCFRAGWLLQISECIPLVSVISAWLLHEQPIRPSVRPSVCDLVSEQTVCQILTKFDMEVLYKKLPSQCQFCDSRLNDTGRRPQIISTSLSIFLDWFR